MIEEKLRFKKGDIFAAIIVAALALAVFFAFIPKETSGDTVLIYLDGELIKELSLSENATFTVSGDYENTVEIKDGKAAIVSSDCPGTDCVHTGWIDSPGRSIVCLPNRVEVVIAGIGEVDFVVG